MDLSKVAVAIKSRSHWQALDVGLQMARQHFWSLILLWWLLALPVSLVVAAFTFAFPTVMILLIWWFKPVYELPLLYYLSRVMFGERPDYKACLKAPFQDKKELLILLSIRRLSLARSFVTPVNLLEGLSGKRRAQRVNVLANETVNVAQWCLFVCYHFEVVLYLGLVVSPLMFLPESFYDVNPIQLLVSEDPKSAFILQLVYLVAMSLVAPFYTAAGFLLYISRRTELEGWDIELQFKRLQSRLSAAVFTLICCLSLSFLSPSPALAETSDQAKSVIEEVVNSEDFGETKTRKEWKYIGEEEEDDSETPQWLKDMFKSIGEFFLAVSRGISSAAPFLQVLFWTAVVAAGFYLAFYIRKHFGHRFNFSRTESESLQPTIKSKQRESKLENIKPQVIAFIEANQHREALSLLYRATLQHFERATSLKLAASATERECVAVVNQERSDEEAIFFQELTQLWVGVAYGHARPGTAEVSDLLERWTEVSKVNHV